MLLKTRLQAEAKKTGTNWEIIEQDYVLSWILEGIATVPELKDNLVFKGGTALRKSYFGNYRFSQDLDFSAIDRHLESTLYQLIIRACSNATKELQALGENAEFVCQRYTEKQPHPEGQQAFAIKGRLPWHRDFHTTVYAEITFNELIILPPKAKAILHPYGENLSNTLHVYVLEEIIAEKIRALLQFSKKLHEKGWGRSRVRDYYDIWRILTEFGQELDLKSIPRLVDLKCSHKEISFEGIESLFEKKLMEHLDKEWVSWLSGIVVDLPDKDILIHELKKLLGHVFSSNNA